MGISQQQWDSSHLDPLFIFDIHNLDEEIRTNNARLAFVAAKKAEAKKTLDLLENEAYPRFKAEYTGNRINKINPATLKTYKKTEIDEERRLTEANIQFKQQIAEAARQYNTLKDFFEILMARQYLINNSIDVRKKELWMTTQDHR